MSYGLLGLRKQMEGEAMQGISDLAGQQRQAKRAEEAMKQAERGQKMSAVGMGATIGMMSPLGPAGAVIGAGAGYVLSEIF
jgi:hypothetical protein